jgi:hypothetical protein
MTSNPNVPDPHSGLNERGGLDWGSIREVSGMGGRVSFVVCMFAVIVASLVGGPHVFYSYHVSHFAVLYVLSLATLAAFPDWGVLKAFWRLLGFVTALGLARALTRHHLETNFLDWISDISGILGGLAPLVVQRLREIQLSGR